MLRNGPSHSITGIVTTTSLALAMLCWRSALNLDVLSKSNYLIYIHGHYIDEGVFLRLSLRCFYLI